MDTIEFRSMDTPGGALSTAFMSPNCLAQPAATAQAAKPAACPAQAACACRTNPVQGASCPLPAKQTTAASAAHSACTCQGAQGDGVTCGDGHIYFGQCETTRVEVLPNMQLDEEGRVLEVSMTLRAICPNRRVAVGIMLTEVDTAGNEHPRGFKAIAVDAHQGAGCCDIAVPRTRFILPESLRVDGCTGVCQGRRHFIVRAEAHYIDVTA